ncbi:MAG TPA: transposase [Anaerolineales bacterium]|jgi:putative transposase|nr:transposase [Anaerolineales bacterium]HQX17309.1 transposase [Anaerolineales bacterium]
MPYRNAEFTQGQYYHVYNRGAGKSKIFYTEDNYRYLLELMRRYLGKYGISVIAYCLMPNHYHFLLLQLTDMPISKFINVLFNAYVQALNLQQSRTGTLFEGRFKHVCVDEWKYLSHLCRYIHRNPVKAGLVIAPEDWAYSNFREWVGLRNSLLKNDEFIQTHFPDPEEYRVFVNDWQDEEKNMGKIGKYIWD